MFAALTLRKAELELYMHTGLDMATGFSMKQPLSTNAGYRCPGFIFANTNVEIEMEHTPNLRSISLSLPYGSIPPPWGILMSRIKTG